MIRPPKYTPAELKAMAQQALQARAAGDDRWMRLVINLFMRTGVHPTLAQQRIEQMARMDVTPAEATA